MNKQDTRQLAMRQIISTLARIAKMDDTCNLNALMNAICTTYHISERTAKDYINELERMGVCKVDYGMNWIWHADEKALRQSLLIPAINALAPDLEFKKEFDLAVAFAVKNEAEYRK